MNKLLKFRKNSELMDTFIIISIILLTLSGVNGIIHLPPKLIQSPGDTSYVFGSTENELIWVFEAEESDDVPTVFNITIDSILQLDYTNNEWLDNVDIIVNVDGLEIGIHIVEITVADNGVPEFAPATKDSVQVTVMETGANSNTVSTPSNSNSESTTSGVNSEDSDKSYTDFMTLILTTSSLLVIMMVFKGYNRKN